MTAASSLYSVVVPAHNESENLEILLPRLYSVLSATAHNFEIVIVDNASSDDTAQCIARFQSTMPELRSVPETTLGYGRAVLRGLHESRGSIIGIMRSDNQEKVEDLVRMLRAVEESDVAFYKGVRMHRMNDGAKRVVISHVYNFLFKVLFGLKSKDLNATPKVFTREYLKAAHLESMDWFIDAEMVIKAERMGFKVKEMDIEYLPRLKGVSNVRFRHIFEFLGNVISWYPRVHYGKFLER